MGNLEDASGNQSEALRYYAQAIEIREKCGDQASSLLATTYLCLSRVYYARENYDVAFNILGKSESLFVKTIGQAGHLMAQ